jgi:hypothetical protein
MTGYNLFDERFDREAMLAIPVLRNLRDKIGSDNVNESDVPRRASWLEQIWAALLGCAAMVGIGTVVAMSEKMLNPIRSYKTIWEGSFGGRRLAQIRNMFTYTGLSRVSIP